MKSIKDLFSIVKQALNLLNNQQPNSSGELINNEYENLLIKHENDIRYHIKLGFELKLYCESLEQKYDAIILKFDELTKQLAIKDSQITQLNRKIAVLQENKGSNKNLPLSNRRSNTHQEKEHIINLKTLPINELSSNIRFTKKGINSPISQRIIQTSSNDEHTRKKINKSSSVLGGLNQKSLDDLKKVLRDQFPHQKQHRATLKTFKIQKENHATHTSTLLNKIKKTAKINQIYKMLLKPQNCKENSQKNLVNNNPKSCVTVVKKGVYIK